MNISYRWLQDLAPGITDPPEAVVHRLALLGAPVEEIVDLGAELDDIVIARVREVRPHPNADRLRLCVVEAGGSEQLQIVCGAPNVEAGSFYPFAPIGATLPGGMTIRKAKLRGEVSEGMLCSPRELGLGRDHAGLMTLQGEWTPGSPLVESIGLNDVRLDIEVTPNRPDLLSHVGVARELVLDGVAGIELPEFPRAMGGNLEIKPAERTGEVGGVKITIEDPSGCPRYMAAVVRGVKVRPSPEWLASRLRAVGLRPINNVVDATNYVLFEQGQPLHAFDLARLGGGQLRIRQAAAGEEIRTLDGVQRTLDAGELVIADAQRPVAVAGVMGGEESEVSGETTDLLLECALFEPGSVRRTARRMGLSTDASYRFERSVDPEGQPRALERLIELIVAVAGGQVEEAALDLQPVPFERARLPLRPTRVEHVLGVSMTAEEIADLLRPIGFDVEAQGGPALTIEVPGFRADITREADLIEEIARRRGYDTFPDELRGWRPGTVPEDPLVGVERLVHELLGSWGFLEARTAPFAPENEGRVPLLNPISAEEGYLRSSLVPGLLRRIEHNWARGNRDIRLYEIGAVFSPSGNDGLPREEVRVAAVFTGLRHPPHWSAEAVSWDVWDLKGLLGDLGTRLYDGHGGEPGGFGPLNPVTRPEERIRVATADGEVRGGGGQVSATALDAPPWAGEVWVLEVALPAAPPERRVAYRPLPEFPAVMRDLALIVPTGVSAAELRRTIEEQDADALESVEPFDVYAGQGVPRGTRSVAWRLRFRRPDRTMTDSEVDEAVNRMLRILEERLGARRR